MFPEKRRRELEKEGADVCVFIVVFVYRDRGKEKEEERGKMNYFGFSDDRGEKGVLHRIPVFQLFFVDIVSLENTVGVDGSLPADLHRRGVHLLHFHIAGLARN